MVRAEKRGSKETGGRWARELFFVFGLSAALVGCKKANNASIACDRDAYVTRSADFGPNDGEGLLLSESLGEEVVNGPFEKPYNSRWLEAVGRASISDTIRYVETKGAKVYRAEPISIKSTLNLTSAAPMPEDLNRAWDDADRPLAGSECGFPCRGKDR